MSKSFLPYGRQCIDDDDIAAVTAVLRGEILTGGPAVQRFEHALAAAVDAPYSVACSNGTAALHLAALALGLGAEDAVVVPTVTFLASANAARYVEAEVRFADVDPDTGLLTPETLTAALGRPGPGKPRAVIAVHLNGRCVDMAGIRAVADRHGLFVIEDACHALGGATRLNGVRAAAGSCAASDLTCFSFHPVKTVAMGEGGAVTTRDPALAERLRRLRNHGMVRDPAAFVQPDEAFTDGVIPNPWYYEMPEIGYNFRVPDILCALGESQLSKLPRFLARRRTLAERYTRALAALSPAVTPVAGGAEEDHGRHLYPILMDFPSLGITRVALMQALQARGIGTQVHYLPVHRQPYYRRRHPDLSLPGADAYYARCLSLPLFPAMTDAEVDYVAAELAAVIGGAL